MTSNTEQDRGGSGSPTATHETQAGSTVLQRVLRIPAVGFAPWIALALLEGPGRVVTAVAVALGLSVVIVVLDRLAGHTTKLLTVVDVVAFAGFLTLALLASPPTQRWLETWFGELANLTLFAVVVVSILVRAPFTLQYAKEETDLEYWDSPVFLKINYTITAVWGLAFAVSSVAGFYGDAVLHDNNNLWTGWVMQIAASLVALQFTSWYPSYASARALAAIGQSDEPAPPVSDFLLPLTYYLAAIGIIALAFGSGPTWLGVTLLVLGVAANLHLRRRQAASSPAPTPPRSTGAR